MPGAPSMYVKVKRKRTTLFFHCEPGDTVLAIKGKVSVVTGVAAADQRLLLGKQNLEDTSSLCDCGVTPQDTGTELYLLYKIPSEADEKWEDFEDVKPGTAETSEAAPADPNATDAA